MKWLVCLLVLAMMAGCAGTPIRWVSLGEYPGTDYDRAWSIIVSTITEDFELSVIEKESGYLLTAWKRRDVGAWDDARVRVAVKVEKRNPFKLKLKVEREVLLMGCVSNRGDEKLERELMEKIKLSLK